MMCNVLPLLYELISFEIKTVKKNMFRIFYVNFLTCFFFVFIYYHALTTNNKYILRAKFIYITVLVLAKQFAETKTRRF